MPLDTPRLSSAPARLFAALLGLFALTACESADQAAYAPATGSSRSALVDLSTGTAIMTHALYADLSDRTTALFEGALDELLEMNHATRTQKLALLETCIAEEDLDPCGSVLLGLGFSPAQFDEDITDARIIAADVGLIGAPLADYNAAFSAAQYLNEGIGLGSALADFYLGAGLTCNDPCRESAGNLLGGIKAHFMAALALPAPAGGGGGDAGAGDAGAGDAGGGSEASVGLPQWLQIVIKLFTWLKDIIDVIYDTDEEDKECLKDADCPSGEFCHVIGPNDCRPVHAQGHLCIRNSECATDCCKPHISTGFLPSCRPADKCN